MSMCILSISQSFRRGNLNYVPDNSPFWHFYFSFPTIKHEQMPVPAFPPRLWVSARRGFFTCRGPALPCSCLYISYIMRRPLAPSGCPKHLSPPSVFTGRSPFRVNVPASISSRARPRRRSTAQGCGPRAPFPRARLCVQISRSMRMFHRGMCTLLSRRHRGRMLGHSAYQLSLPRVRRT